MKIFNVPVKVNLDRLHEKQRKIAAWLQRKSEVIPVRVQHMLLVILCVCITVYCVLLILQPLIN